MATAGATPMDVDGDTETAMRPLVGVIMGSDSDWPVMAAAAEALAEFGVPYEVGVVSAHRTPRRDGRLRAGGGRPRPAR